jgi:hypothetical protein
VDLDRAAQEWQTHGFVILPGFVPAAELKPALDALPAMYPTAAGFHDGSDERRERFTVDEWAGIRSFPFAVHRAVLGPECHRRLLWWWA